MTNDKSNLNVLKDRMSESAWVLTVAALWRIMRLGMKIDDMRQLGILVMVLAGAALAACGAVPDARPIALDSPEVQRVRAALAGWPRPGAEAPLRRSFAAGVRLGDLRVAAHGTVEYYAPRDFRVTAATEDGALVFDGRVNWGGAILLRGRPGLDAGAFEALLADMVRAFEMPAELEGIEAGATKMALTFRKADGYDYTWIFDRADGRLRETEVDLGLFDTLRITYGDYSAQGWPGQLRLVRFACRYEVSFSFTDGGHSEPRR
jgi:hypothetical protein